MGREGRSEDTCRCQNGVADLKLEYTATKLFSVLSSWSYVFQVSKKYVSKELAKEIHAKAQPFVKWLKEAEEESEGSEDEEEVEEDGDNVEVI